MKDKKYWDNYIKEYEDNPNFLKDIPDEFQTQEMWDSYVENGAFFIFGIKGYIPERFQTQEMWNKFIEERGEGSVFKVPREFQTQEMWNNYLNKKDYFYTTIAKVPKEFQTQEMWDKSMEEMGYNPYFASEVPDEFVTIEILNNVLENKKMLRNFDFSVYEQKLLQLEEIRDKKIYEEIAKSYIVNQERDYETGSRLVPFGEDENYNFYNLSKENKVNLDKNIKATIEKVESNNGAERDYETGSRADSALDTEYEREM